MTIKEFNKELTETLSKRSKNSAERKFEREAQKFAIEREQLRFSFKTGFWSKLKGLLSFL